MSEIAFYYAGRDDDTIFDPEPGWYARIGNDGEGVVGPFETEHDAQLHVFHMASDAEGES